MCQSRTGNFLSVTVFDVESNGIDFVFAFERERAALRHFGMKDIKVRDHTERQSRSEERLRGVLSCPPSETLRHSASSRLTALSGSLPTNLVPT